MTDAAPHHNSSPAPSRRALYMELTKARLSALVVVTAGVGYLLGNPQGVNLIDTTITLFAAVFSWNPGEFIDVLQFAVGTVDWLAFAIVLLGTGLAAAGTGALNQWMEHDRDAAMERTRHRPLPSGAMSRNEAFLAGVLMVLVGSGLLFFLVNPLAGFLTILTATIYILIYTPMKSRSTLNTLVGAVCGALPPMIGWAAASGGIGLGAWILAGILFIWQLPHFLALAWMYRDDYARGGFRMLPIQDRGGALTSHIVLLSTMLLIPLTLLAALVGMTGYISGFVAFLLGAGFVFLAARLYRHRSRGRARALFIGSIIYLPILMIVMTVDQARLPVRVMLFQMSLPESHGIISGAAAPASGDGRSAISSAE